ncbi:MAG: hypothetical protein AAF696_13710, partial [Bacteroidota bacterium]
GLEWSTHYGKHRMHDLDPEIYIYLMGPKTGCLEYGLQMKRKDLQDDWFGYPDLEKLDAGMKIFFRDPDFPKGEEEIFLNFNRYPLFQVRSNNLIAKDEYPNFIPLKACIDPLFPFEKDRSVFTFGSEHEQIKQKGIPCSYFTNIGFDIHLIPEGDQSQLVFAAMPDRLSGTEANVEESGYYLTPKGKYQIKAPRYGKEEIQDPHLICGVSGLEYIKVAQGTKGFIEFIPEQAAYAGTFLSIRTLLNDFNFIQKKFQASVWKDPDKESKEGNPDLDVSGKSTDPIDLPEGTDLDMEIEAKDPPALNISDKARLAMLDYILLHYFPDNFYVSEEQRNTMVEIPIVEQWIQWYRDLMKEAIRQNSRGKELLSTAVRTSWAYISSDATEQEEKKGKAAIYFAQPDNAVLHMAEKSSNEFLDYLEVPSMALPKKWKSKPFPMMPYGNVDPRGLTDIRQMELTILNPLRRATIQEIGKADSFRTDLTAKKPGNPIGTTPQGLIAEFSDKWKNIKKLILAKDTKGKSIGFANIGHGTPLKSALQSNQLFLVISKPEALLAYFSDENLKKSGLNLKNELDILDWVFELGPSYWEKHNTIMVFKYTNTSLIELASHPERWFMADTFNDSPASVSLQLQQLLNEGIELGNSLDPKEKRKYESLAIAGSQPNWTGILMLNVHVPLRGLPDSLKALAGGMNPDLFYSRFVGIELTPMKVNLHGTHAELAPQSSSVFALIDYNNPEVPPAEPSGYNFHVPSLTIVFENSLITHFAAEIYLILEKLFDEKARLLNSSDNIISLKGVAEEHNGRITYAFGFSGANRFQLSANILEEIEITRVQFVTDPIQKRGNELLIGGSFRMWGRLRFAYNRDFDILSFGRTPALLGDGKQGPAADTKAPDYLSISNLSIDMSFKLNERENTVSDREFGFNPNHINADLVKSGWRKESLYEQFPLNFRGFVNVKTDKPAKDKDGKPIITTGYMPVNIPSKKAKLGTNYYAIKYDIKLGTLGALNGSKALVAGILVAWNPGQKGMYVGLKLPGTNGDKKEITLQGLLKLSFGSIRFVVFDKEIIPQTESPAMRKAREKRERKVGYMLNLRNIKLKFFLLTFPPIGRTEMTLFGDPREGIDRVDRLVGWYAAYVK